MRNYIFCTFCTIAMLLLHSKSLAQDYGGDIIELDEKNYIPTSQKYQYMFIQFYSSECDVCRRLNPEYSEVVRTVRTFSDQIAIAKMNADTNPDVAKRFEVYGYPTFIFVENKDFAHYFGGQSAREMADWIKKKISPIVKKIFEESDLEAVRKEYEVAVLYGGEIENRLYNNFLDIASDSLEDCTMIFLATANKELLQKYNLTKDGEVAIFHVYTKDPILLRGDFDPTELYGFVGSNQFPDVMPFSPKVAERIFGKMLTTMFLLRGRTSDGYAAQQVLIDAKDDLKSELKLSIADITETIGLRLMEFLGVKIGDLPAVYLSAVTHDVTYA